MLIPTDVPNLGKAYTWTGLHTFAKAPMSAIFTGIPTGVTATTSTLVVNPASATANADLIWAGLAGVAKFRVDEDGDLNMAGSLSTGVISIQIDAGRARYWSSQPNGHYFYGTGVGHLRVTMGAGALAQKTLTAHLDQDDVTIRRDVDGDASTYNEAGALLHLHRDITNVGSDGGTFLECSTDGSTVLFGIKAAKILCSTTLAFRTGNDAAGQSISAGYVTANSACLTNLLRSIGSGANLSVYPKLAATNGTPGITTLRGGHAAVGSTSNKVGGVIDIYGGTGDGAGGQTAAHGGQLKLHGGNAASDLDSSNGGDVLIYGGVLGTNGVPGSDGAVRITDADGSTNVVKVLNGVTQIGAPDGANHLDIAIDGELTLAGTARVTQGFSIANAALGKGASAPSEVIVGTFDIWEFGVNDDAVFTFHVPHDYASGTDIELHIDWQINEAGGDEIKWEITWAAVPHDSTEAIDAPTHSGSSDTGDIVVPGTVRFLTENTLTIPGASISPDDQIGVTLKRIAITDGTPPANEPGVTDIHIQYTADKLGEAT